MHLTVPSSTRERQTKVKKWHDSGCSKTREFLPGDQVLVHNFRGKDKWQGVTVIFRIGCLAYEVRVQERIRHVHIVLLLHASPKQEVIPVLPILRGNPFQVA